MHCYVCCWYVLLRMLLIRIVTYAADTYCYVCCWYVLLRMLLICIVTYAADTYCYVCCWYVLLRMLLICIVTYAADTYCYVCCWYVLLRMLLIRIRVRLHCSQNRHNSANQHLSGCTWQTRVATFNPTCVSILIAMQRHSNTKCTAAGI